MKITVKTLYKEQFDLQVEESTTVLAVKGMISEQKGYTVASQKLIWNGKVLSEDGNSISSYGCKDNDFLVVMVTKPKEGAGSGSSGSGSAATTAPAAAAAPAPTPAAAPAPAPAPAPAAVAAPPPTSSAPPPSSGGGLGSTFNAMLSGPELETALASIQEIVGCSREEASAAMQAAFNNPERAIQYLLDPPPNVNFAAPRQASPSPVAAPAPAPAPAAAAAAPTGPINLFGGAPPAANPAAADDGPLAVIRRLPHFNIIRATVQQQPHLLAPLLQELSNANPGLVQLINQNQEAFIAMMNEPVDPAELQASLAASGLATRGGGGGGGGGAVPLQGVTAEDNVVIDRLLEFGGGRWDRMLVTQAYLLCDRNEELAINYLFDPANNEFGGDFGDDDGLNDDGQDL